ncbi:TetR/AcrR family transcriptional regulator [Microbacterium sp. NPDC056052]|uniref:TetR/AcrR family transcriptional regulator n=1 Tax=Microbacterium sp. NPDC056052 TaxID=3345695 RepID=UPI0035DB214E
MPEEGSGPPLLAPAARGERADAARNREKVLAAAATLLAAAEPSQVSMGQIARAAGVGRATLYRRYPDVHSIAVALLDEHERDLQRRMMEGPPPLGPGASPGERLTAFFAAMVDLLERFGPLLLAAESGAGRFETGAYGFWRTHVSALLAQSGVADASARADLLLAAVDPELHRFQRRSMSAEQRVRQLSWLARSVLDEG